MKGLTSNNTLIAVQKLFDKFFDLNSLLDRHVYLLDIVYNMPNYQLYMHENISHQFPLLADKIQEFGSLRGDLFYRGVVPEHRENYNSVSAMTEGFVLELAKVEKLCADAIKTAIDNDDLMYEDFLRDFEISELAKYTKQAIVFQRAIESYENNNQLFKWNDDFKSYIISEFKGGD